MILHTGKCKVIGILGAFVLFCRVELPAQEVQAPDSLGLIEREILAHPETDVSVLGKSRAALVEAIQAGDTARARRVVAFLDRRFDTSKVITLYPGEKLLLAYWLREYEQLFAFVEGDGVDVERRIEKIYPENDLMFDKLRVESDRARPQLIGSLRTSGMSADQADFLELLFDDVMGAKDDSEESRAEFQELMNNKADEYLADHKDSKYNAFVRDNIRYVIARSDWGWGYEIGAGYLALPPNLNDHMKNFGLLSIALEGAYKEWYGCLRMDIGAANHLKKGFSYEGEWKDGLQVMHIGALIAGGQKISLGNNFTLTPTVGIGVLNFSPPEEVRNQEGNDVSLTIAAFALGANVDIPLGGEQGAPFVRLNVGHRVALTNNAIARGGYTFITLGINFFNRPLIRDL